MASVVSIVLDGQRIVSAQPAWLTNGHVIGPVDPFVRRFADRITVDFVRQTIRFQRGEKAVLVTLGKPPIVAYLREGRLVVPLAPLARALGAIQVSYDRHASVLAIIFPPLPPPVTPTPYVARAPLLEPGPTFTPTSTPLPRSTPNGFPEPRRTPIPVSAPTPCPTAFYSVQPPR